MSSEVNVLALVKEGERFIFLYDDESSATLLQTFGRFAADKELSFSWYDAAVLSQKLRQLQDRQLEDSDEPARVPMRDGWPIDENWPTDESSED